MQICNKKNHSLGGVDPKRFFKKNSAFLKGGDGEWWGPKMWKFIFVLFFSNEPIPYQVIEFFASVFNLPKCKTHPHHVALKIFNLI